MARSFIRQSTNIRPSDTYQDAMTLENALTASYSLEDDLNYLRTALKNAKGTSQWFDPVVDSFNLQAVHDKKFTFWIQKTDDVTVPAGQNFVVLTGSAKPGENVAYGPSALGAITAKITGADVGAHSTETSTNTGNICEVRLATTNDELFTTGSSKIYGLLQVGQSATDASAFTDTGANQGQISFVYFDPVTELPVAVPVAQMEGKTIEYAFRKRTDFFNLPENAFDPGVTFTESLSMSEIDLQVVYNNSSSGRVDLATGKNFTVNLNGNAEFELRDNAIPRSFLKTDRTNQRLDLGTDTRLLAGTKMLFQDTDQSHAVSFRAPSLIANTDYVLPDADGASNTVMTTNGSAVMAWRYVGDCLNTKKAWFVAGANIPANTSIALSSFTNPNNISLGSVAATFVNDFDVFWNTGLTTSGINQAADTDVYYVSSTQIAFNHNIKKDDIIQIIQRR